MSLEVSEYFFNETKFLPRWSVPLALVVLPVRFLYSFMASITSFKRAFSLFMFSPC